MLTFLLGDLPVRLDIQAVTLWAMRFIPDGTARLGPRERTVRIMLKVVADWLLGEAAGLVDAGKLPLERPQCPKGADKVAYAVWYLGRAAAVYSQQATIVVQYGEGADGAINLTGAAIVAATPSLAAASHQEPGDDPSHPAGDTAASDPRHHDSGVAV